MFRYPFIVKCIEIHLVKVKINKQKDMNVSTDDLVCEFFQDTDLFKDISYGSVIHEQSANSFS